MKNFSDINKILKKEDYIYSELTALAYFNTEFFSFLNDEKFKYTLQDNVFNNSLFYELQKWNIILKKDIIKVCVEKDWQWLKDCFEVSLNLKKIIKDSSEIIIKDKLLIFKQGEQKEIIFRDKILSDMITKNDLEKSLHVEIMTLYSNNIDSLIVLFINHIKNYLKPEFLIGINYFLDVFREKYIQLNWNNYKNFKVSGLGFRKDELPKLCYNNLGDYCKDLIFYKEAFREYDLMLKHWKDIKNNTLNKEYLLPIFKNKFSLDDFIYILSKYFSLSVDDYYKLGLDNEVIHLPSKKEFKNKIKENELKISYKTNEIKDLVICSDWGNIQMRINVGFGLAPEEFIYSVEIIDNINLRKLF